MTHEEDERVCVQSKSVRQQCVPGRERLSDEQLPPILSGRTDMISMMNHEVFPVASEGNRAQDWRLTVDFELGCCVRETPEWRV